MVTVNRATDDDTWTVMAVEADQNNGSWQVQAFAICATIAP